MHRSIILDRLDYIQYLAAWRFREATPTSMPRTLEGRFSARCRLPRRNARAHARAGSTAVEDCRRRFGCFFYRLGEHDRRQDGIGQLHLPYDGHPQRAPAWLLLDHLSLGDIRTLG